MKEFVRFLFIIGGVMLAAFGVHVAVLRFMDSPMLANKIVFSYSGNYLIAVGIIFGLLNAPKKLQSSLGFLFMLGSGFKFVFFFVFFYPYFLQDGELTRVEFFTFFIPYSVSLATGSKLLIDKLSKE